MGSRVGLVWFSSVLCGAKPPHEPVFDGQTVEGIMDCEISRQEVIKPGGIELTKETEQHMGLGPSTPILSVACGTEQLEL